jgi:putative ABC transport system permease protein
MKLALYNIVYDRIRFLVAITGIAFAVFLMIFQGCVLNGFLTAASQIVDAANSDLWVTARGIACFDFPARIERRFVEMCRMDPGVASTRRMCMGFAEFRKPGGLHQIVALIGADPDTASRLPVATVSGSAALENQGVLIDTTAAALLNVPTFPWETEINGRRARVVWKVDGFSSFLGSPYVFSSYSDAARYLSFGPEDGMYVLLRLKPGFSPAEVKNALQSRMPDVQVWTNEEFSRQARTYWLQQTGAGGTVITSAVLGFVIGMLIVSQAIYAVTMEHIEEFATLKALGASRSYVARVVLTQALACGVVGCTVAAAIAGPIVHAASTAVAWIRMPWWLPAAMFVPGLIMCSVASLVSARKAMIVDPAEVFRV